MAFDMASVYSDPRWSTVREDRDLREKAKDTAFDLHVQSEPRAAEWYAVQPAAAQRQIRAEFKRRLVERDAEAWGPEPPSVWDRLREAVWNPEGAAGQDAPEATSWKPERDVGPGLPGGDVPEDYDVVKQAAQPGQAELRADRVPGWIRAVHPRKLGQRWMDFSMRLFRLPGRLGRGILPDVDATDYTGKGNTLLQSYLQGRGMVQAQQDLAQWDQMDMQALAGREHELLAAAMADYTQRETQWGEMMPEASGMMLKYGQDVARTMGPMSESVMLGLSKWSSPLVFGYWKDQGKGMLLAKAFRDTDLSRLTAEELTYVSKMAELFGTIYAGVEFASRIVPAQGVGMDLGKRLMGMAPRLAAAFGPAGGKIVNQLISLLGESGEEGVQQVVEDLFGNLVAGVVNKARPAESHLVPLGFAGVVGRGLSEALRSLPVLAPIAGGGAVLEAAGEATGQRQAERIAQRAAGDVAVNRAFARSKALAELEQAGVPREAAEEILEEKDPRARWKRFSHEVRSARRRDLQAAIDDLQERVNEADRAAAREVGARPRATVRARDIVVPGSEPVPRTAQTLARLAAELGVDENTVARLPRAEQERLLNDPEYLQLRSAQMLAARLDGEEARDAAQTRTEQRGRELEREGADGERPAAEAGGGDRTAEGGEGPPPEGEPPVPGGVTPRIARATLATPMQVKSPKDRSRLAKGFWAIVDMDDLDIAGGEAAGLQQRDRSRAASAEQARRLYQDFDPEELGAATTSQGGAPIVDEAGRIVAGYGRRNVLEMVYQGGGSREEAYRAFLAQQAEAKNLRGQLDGKRRPVLVRVATEYENTDAQEFAADSNYRAQLGFSETENALKDAQLLRERDLVRLLNVPENGDVLAASNRDFVRAFVDALGAQEGAELLDRHGNPSPILARRIERAVLAGMLGRSDEALRAVNELVERADDYGVKSVISGITQAAPRLLKLSGTEFDLAPWLEKAIPVVLEAKRQILDTTNRVIRSASDYFAQQDMFRQADPEVQELVEILLGMRSAKALGELLRRYHELASSFDRATMDMFGGDIPESRAIDLLKKVRAEQEAGREGSSQAEGDGAGGALEGAGRRDEAGGSGGIPGPDQAGAAGAAAAGGEGKGRIGIDGRFYDQERDDAAGELDDLLGEEGDEIRFSIRPGAVRESAAAYGPGELFGGGVGGPTQFEQYLKNVSSEMVRGGSDRFEAQASRALQQKARALLEALSTGRLTEEAARERWEQAVAQVDRETRKRLQAQRRRSKGVQGDLFAGGAKPEGMLLAVRQYRWQEIQDEREEARAKEALEEYERDEPATYLGEPVLDYSAVGEGAYAERYGRLSQRRDEGERLIRGEADRLRDNPTATDDERAAWARVSYSYAFAESDAFEDLNSTAECYGLKLVPVRSDWFYAAIRDGVIYVAAEEDAFRILQHELFHNLKSAGVEAATELVNQFDEGSRTFRRWHALLRKQYEAAGWKAPSVATAKEEAAAALFTDELVFRDEEGDLELRDALLNRDEADTLLLRALDALEYEYPAVQTEMRFAMRPGESSKDQRVIEVGARYLAAQVRGGEITVDQARSILVDRWGAKINPYVDRIHAAAIELIRTGELEIRIGLNRKGAIDDSGTETGSRAAAETGNAGAGRGSADTGAAGGGGRGGRTDIRVAGGRSIPQPPDHVGTGTYDVDEDQRLGINLMLDRFEKGGRGFLLADGTGVGKTSQLLVLAHEYQKRTGKRALIVTQNLQVAKGSFLDDAERLGLDINSFDIATYTGISGSEPKYFGKLQRSGPTPTIPITETYGLIIFDEAHNLKNDDSQKTMSGITLMKDADHVVYATATPMDRPTGAAYFMSEITGIPMNRMAKMLGFEIREVETADGKKRRQAVPAKGSDWSAVLENLMKLREIAVRDGALLRREYPFLGSMHQEDVSLPAEAKAIEASVYEYYERLIKRTRNILAKMRFSGNRTHALTQWNEQFKVARIVELAKRAIAEGRRPVIVAEYINDSKRLHRPEPRTFDRGGRVVLDDSRGELWDQVVGRNIEIKGTIGLLEEALNEAGITFGQVYGAGSKAEQIEAFQKNKVQAVIMTPQSGGTGVNLDDVIGDGPRDMIIAGASWGGDVFQQVLGRISRRNTKTESRVFFVHTDSFADGKRRAIITQKIDILKRIQEGHDIDRAGFSEGGEEEEGGAAAGAAGVEGYVEAAWPGGELGTPFQVLQEDNEAARLVIELPELVQLAARLNEGKFPQIVRSLRALHGAALGVFRHRDEAGEADIQLRADIFDLVTPQERRLLLDQAIKRALEMASEQGIKDIKALTREAYRELLKQALAEAKQHNPVLASKVCAHEIGHLVDWLPDHLVRGRGNILGHLATLKNYMKDAIEGHPDDVAELLSPQERRQLYNQARREANAELGRKASQETKKQRAAEIYKRLVQEAADTRGLVTRAQILEDLEPMIAWWRGTETMEEYFAQPQETYAEAFSILVNNPEALRAGAPTFWRTFFAYMDRKPKVKSLYNQIQEGIRSGQVQRDRVTALRTAFVESDEKADRIEMAGRRLSRQALLERGAMLVDRTLGPMYLRFWQHDRKSQENTGAARHAISSYLYRGAKHERFLTSLRAQVIQPLLRAGLTWTDLAEFMFHNHLIENRSGRVDGQPGTGDLRVYPGIANPLGWTSKTSMDRLREWERDLGPDTWKALQEAREAFRSVYQRDVVDLLARFDILSPELQQILEERVFYATFAVAKGQEAAAGSIEEALNMTFGRGVGPRIYKQVGYLGDQIRNPATSTMQKALSLQAMAYREKAKKEIVDYLLAIGDPMIKPADTRWTGRRREIVYKESDRVKTVVYLHKGRVHGFYVSRAIAEMFDASDPVEMGLLAQVAVGANNFVKGLYTRFNFGFFGPAYRRDKRAFMLFMPGATRRGERSYGAFRKEARAAARASVRGEENAIASEALERGMLISKAEFGQRDTRDVTAERIIRSYNIPVESLTEGEVGRWRKLRELLYRPWQWYGSISEVNERAVKIAAMLYLDRFHPSMPEWKKQELVHEAGGSPDFLQKSRANPFLDLFVQLFYNARKEAARRTVKAWRDRPGEMALKTTRHVLVPAVLTWLIASGKGIEIVMRAGFGDDGEDEEGLLGRLQVLKDMYEAIPQYFKTHYRCVPLYWVDRAQGKVMFLTLPMEDYEQVVHNTAWNAADALAGDEWAWNEILSYAGGQLPTGNPIMKLLVDVPAFYLAGVNPMDQWRGEHVLDERVAKARDWRATRDLAKHAWNTLGGGIVHRMDTMSIEAPPATAVEKWLKAPVVRNLVGRWIRVASRGQVEDMQAAGDAVERERARTQLDAIEDIQERIRTGQWPERTRERLASDPYYREYMAGRRGRGGKAERSAARRAMGPVERALDRAPSKAARQAMIRELMQK